MTFNIFTVCGFIGDFCILLAYFLLQSGRLVAEDFSYILLNFFGAVGIMLSLVAQFNWPILFMETCWISISLLGMYRVLRLRRVKQQA